MMNVVMLLARGGAGGGLCPFSTRFSDITSLLLLPLLPSDCWRCRRSFEDSLITKYQSQNKLQPPQ